MVSVLRCVTKSFTNLINTSYSMKNCTSNCESNQDSGILSNPLSFLRSGYFHWSDADLYSRGGGGFYWSLRSANTTYSSSLLFYDTYLYPQYSYARGNGFAVRCVDKSFTTLINTRYSMSNTSGENNRDSGALSGPLSFLRSGGCSWNDSIPRNRNNIGNFWSRY